MFSRKIFLFRTIFNSLNNSAYFKSISLNFDVFIFCLSISIIVSFSFISFLKFIISCLNLSYMLFSLRIFSVAFDKLLCFISLLWQFSSGFEKFFSSSNMWLVTEMLASFIIDSRSLRLNLYSRSNLLYSTFSSK